MTSDGLMRLNTSAVPFIIPTAASTLQSLTVSNTCQFLSRDAIHKRGPCRHAVSVCPSRSRVVSKRLKRIENCTQAFEWYHFQRS